MRILLTGGAGDVAAKLAKRLAARHSVRLADRVANPHPGDQPSIDYAISAFGHDASTRLLLQDRDALILIQSAPLDGDTNHAVIDVTTRCTYNLLVAAVEAGVRRVVLLSTLDLMQAYAPELTVSERWRPRPTTEPRLLGAYLTECVCREFGREHKLDITVLRIGDLTDNDAAEIGEAALFLGDLEAAVEAALTADAAPWAVYHLQSDVPDARFSTTLIRQRLSVLNGGD